MERINITPNNEKVLPLTVNGKDFDIVFNAGDGMVTTRILGMADELAEYQKEGLALKLEDPKGDPTKQIKKMRAFAEKGVELCKSFSGDMCTISPEWASVVGDNFVPLTVYERILMALAQIISESKAESKALEQMEGER